MIASGGEAAGIEVEYTNVVFLVEEGRSVVSGAIVDDDDFEVWVVDRSASIETGAEAIGSVVSADDDRKTRRICGKGIGESEVAKGC